MSGKLILFKLFNKDAENALYMNGGMIFCQLQMKSEEILTVLRIKLYVNAV